MDRVAILNLSLLVLSVQLVALTAAAAIGRGVNRYRASRAEQVCAVLRGSLILLTAGEPDEVEAAVDSLSVADHREWRAIEPSVRGLLTKVRGDAHASVVRVIARRGLIDAALADLRGSWLATRRAKAAELLGAAGVDAATDLLIEALADREVQVRVVATRALGRIGDPRAVGPLLDGIAAGVPPRVIATAVAGIDRISRVSLEPSLTHQDATHRAVAAEVAGLVLAVDVIPVLVTLLDDPEPEVRIRSARALGRCGSPQARPALERATRPGNLLPLRVVATRALSQLADDSAVPILRELFADPRVEVARLAAVGLLAAGPAGENTVVEALHEQGLRGDVARNAMADARRRGAPARLPVQRSPHELPAAAT